MRPYRLHFTDASLAALEELGLDQDALRTAIDAGTKFTRDANLVVVRHAGLEVEVRTLGEDYTVTAIRHEGEWPRGRPTHPYLRQTGEQA